MEEKGSYQNVRDDNPIKNKRLFLVDTKDCFRVRLCGLHFKDVHKINGKDSIEVWRTVWVYPSFNDLPQSYDPNRWGINVDSLLTYGLRLSAKTSKMKVIYLLYFIDIVLNTLRHAYFH